MAKEPQFVSIGRKNGSIDVQLSYRIIELFSEGLYASPNKAVEELVINSFDAGARRVQILASSNLHAQGATLVVIDDGSGMDASGLKQHWLIGISNKRRIHVAPDGRQQIGRFGIGKLATYVLAERLSHITKHKGKYYATSMDFAAIDKRIDREVEPKTPIKIPLRALTESEAIEALSPWTNTDDFKRSDLKLFGKGAAPSWTVAILSSLKPKVHEIKPGMLEWLLRTAMPLRPDFAVWLGGKKLSSSKQGKGLIDSWVLGKDLIKIPRPASKKIVASEDKNAEKTSEYRFGLIVPGLGRVTGYAEAYKDLLTGKSDEVGRSYGFFVYVRDRLLNVLDGHFGISPNKLSHGAFGRFRLVVRIDSLDTLLRSNREGVSEGPVLEAAHDLLIGIFNAVRPTIDQHDSDEAPGAKLSRKLAGSPGSLSRTPIVQLARAVVTGKVKSRYLLVPNFASSKERAEFLAMLEDRAAKADAFISGLIIDDDGSPEDGIARYDTATGRLLINGWHPFVATFRDEFDNKKARQPLEILAMAEVLAEAHLYALEVDDQQIEEFLSMRDQILRDFANESGRRSPFAAARKLLEARNNPNALEEAVCAAFTSLGFEAKRIGGNGNADGVAKALLSPDAQGRSRQYAVSLEAKSKAKDKGKVAAATVNTGRVIRHRDKEGCQHALVVGRAFPTDKKGDESALVQDIEADRAKTAKMGERKTITLINIDDLAHLVRLRPIKQLGLKELRELFERRTAAESRSWIEAIESRAFDPPPYARIVKTIAEMQKDNAKAPVKFAGLRIQLQHLKPPTRYETDGDLREVCAALAQISDNTMFVRRDTVELDQSADNVIAAIDAAMKEQSDD
jgi:Histidine kinase-, DNA gyrase B-, and HSP90-like ATPase